jgi:hypothetical protein
MNSACLMGRRGPAALRGRQPLACRAIALPPKQAKPVRSTTALTAYALGPEGLHRPIHEELVSAGAATRACGAGRRLAFARGERCAACGASPHRRPPPAPACPPRAPAPQVRTVYIAETMLPTKHGKFRLRGYKHSVGGGRLRGLTGRGRRAGDTRPAAAAAARCGVAVVAAAPVRLRPPPLWSVRRCVATRSCSNRPAPALTACRRPARPAPQIDGGRTFVEPTAIICGSVEGKENVSAGVAGRRRGPPARQAHRGRRAAPAPGAAARARAPP